MERLPGRAFGLGVLGEAAVLALAVHQHEAGRVPELVAEVAVALAALGIEVDVAAEAGERAEREAERVGAEAGDAVRELGGGVLLHARRRLRAAQAGGALLEQRLEGDAVDQVDRVEDVAFRLAHPLALRVAHQAVDVDVVERDLAGEVQGHHDHPRDPEEDDVVAGDEHRRRQEELELLRLLRPAERRERHQRRRVPGVEDVGVAPQRAGVARGLGLRARLVLAARDEDLAAVAVPGRDLVAPPELARDRPVLDVLHPLVVGVDPLRGIELDRAGLDRVDRLAGDARAVAAGLGHRHEPLVGEHRLDDLAGAHADRHRVLVRHRLLEEALRLEVAQHRLPRVVAVEALVRRGAVLVDLRVEREDRDQRDAVAQRAGVVVEVVRAGDLDAARAELAVDEVVGDDRNAPVAERQVDELADQVPVAVVVGMDGERAVGEHRLGPRRRDVHALHRLRRSRRAAARR